MVRKKRNATLCRTQPINHLGHNIVSLLAGSLINEPVAPRLLRKVPRFVGAKVGGESGGEQRLGQVWRRAGFCKSGARLMCAVRVARG
jgi:hypothetical protein